MSACNGLVVWWFGSAEPAPGENCRLHLSLNQITYLQSFVLHAWIMHTPTLTSVLHSRLSRGFAKVEASWVRKGNGVPP